MARNLGSFTWYGATANENRLVELIQTPSGKYTIYIERTNFAARIVDTEEEGRRLLVAAHEIAWKDQGASEIEWPEAPEADWDRRLPDAREE